MLLGRLLLPVFLTAIWIHEGYVRAAPCAAFPTVSALLVIRQVGDVIVVPTSVRTVHLVVAVAVTAVVVGGRCCRADAENFIPVQLAHISIVVVGIMVMVAVADDPAAYRADLRVPVKAHVAEAWRRPAVVYAVQVISMSGATGDWRRGHGGHKKI